MFDVRTTFSIRKLHFVYDLVGDVMPPGALPFAEDWGGNLYCLMITGSAAGRVVYWRHERESGDHHVDLVAATLGEFLDGLVPDPRHADGE